MRFKAFLEDKKADLHFKLENTVVFSNEEPAHLTDGFKIIVHDVSLSVLIKLQLFMNYFTFSNFNINMPQL